MKVGSRARRLEDEGKDHCMGSMHNCTTSVKFPVKPNTSHVMIPLD
jgi:hypothetical protein